MIVGGTSVTREKVFYHFMFTSICILMLFTTLIVIYELSGVNWIKGFVSTLYYAYGSPTFLFESLLRSVPLFLISTGLIFPFTAGIWNIGAEGQFYIGAVSAAAAALALGNLPPPIPLILATLSGCAGGALYALIPAYLRVKHGINELLTSLMLNFVAVHFVSYLLLGPMRNPSTNFAETPPIPNNAVAPILIPGTRFNVLTVVALTLMVISFFILSKTGFAISLKYMGSNPTAAQCAGVDIVKLTFSSMAISGFFAGLAGAHEALGVIRAVRMGISLNYGYVAIGLAYFGGLHPLGTFAVSLFAAGIINGTLMCSFFYNIPVGVYEILLGATPLYVVTSRRLSEKFLRSLLVKNNA